MSTPSGREVLIWLNSIGVSHANIDKLINSFEDLSEIWTANSELIYSIKSIKPGNKP